MEYPRLLLLLGLLSVCSAVESASYVWRCDAKHHITRFAAGVKSVNGRNIVASLRVACSNGINSLIYGGKITGIDWNLLEDIIHDAELCHS